MISSGKGYTTSPERHDSWGRSDANQEKKTHYAEPATRNPGAPAPFRRRTECRTSPNRGLEIGRPSLRGGTRQELVANTRAHRNGANPLRLTQLHGRKHVSKNQPGAPKRHRARSDRLQRVSEADQSGPEWSGPVGAGHSQERTSLSWSCWVMSNWSGVTVMWPSARAMTSLSSPSSR